MKTYNLISIIDNISLGTATYNNRSKSFEIDLTNQLKDKYLMVIARIIDAASRKGSFRILKVGDGLFFSNVSPLAWQAVRQMLFLYASIIVEDVDRAVGFL